MQGNGTVTKIIRTKPQRGNAHPGTKGQPITTGKRWTRTDKRVFSI